MLALRIALPRPFDRITAQMHDRVDALRDAKGVGEFRDIRADEFFFLVDFFQRTKIRDLQYILACQFAPQVRADVTRGAGNENGLHELTLMSKWLGSFTVMRHSVRASFGSISVAECSSDALSQITRSPTLYLSR